MDISPEKGSSLEFEYELPKPDKAPEFVMPRGDGKVVILVEDDEGETNEKIRDYVTSTAKRYGNPRTLSRRRTM